MCTDPVLDVKEVLNGGLQGSFSACPTYHSFNFLVICVCMSACEYRCLRRPEALNPLELELQAVVIHLLRVLGTKWGPLEVLLTIEPPHQLLLFLMKNI